jgi:hypothetical protein
MIIKSPEKYSGRTLEGHLRLYDWKNDFYAFERAIKTSPFDGMCNSAFVSSRVGSRGVFAAKFPSHFCRCAKQIKGNPPNITKPYRPSDPICPSRDAQVNPSYKLIRPDSEVDDNLIEDEEKGKAISSNPSTFSLELSSGSLQKRLSLLALLLSQGGSFVFYFSKHY